MRGIFLKAGGLAALLGGVLLGVGRAEPQERTTPRVTHRWVQQFGMVTPAYGQTLRLHAAHLGLTSPPDPDTPAGNPPPEPEFPPGPCRVLLQFFDSEGQPVGFQKTQELRPGKATFVDHTFELPTTNALPPGPCRASVWVFQEGLRGGTPPDPCKATLELLDTTTGKSLLHMLPAVQRALPAVQR